MRCRLDLRKDTLTSGFSLAYFIDFYNKSGKKADFISRKQFFNLLMGDKEITEMIVSGKSEEEIREKVKPELDKYKTVREKYLLY